jgi:hypothetical protein
MPLQVEPPGIKPWHGPPMTGTLFGLQHMPLRERDSHSLDVFSHGGSTIGRILGNAINALPLVGPVLRSQQLGLADHSRRKLTTCSFSSVPAPVPVAI